MRQHELLLGLGQYRVDAGLISARRARLAGLSACASRRACAWDAVQIGAQAWVQAIQQR